MNKTEELRDDGASNRKARPSEAEIMQLLQDASAQYEAYLHLADLAGVPDFSDAKQPKYAWDNPIGLVVTRDSDAELV